MVTCSLANKQLANVHSMAAYATASTSISSAGNGGADERQAILAAQQGIRMLLGALLAPNPAHRPTLESVLTNEWLRPYHNRTLNFGTLGPGPISISTNKVEASAGAAGGSEVTATTSAGAAPQRNIMLRAKVCCHEKPAFELSNPPLEPITEPMCGMLQQQGATVALSAQPTYLSSARRFRPAIRVSDLHIAPPFKSMALFPRPSLLDTVSASDGGAQVGKAPGEKARPEDDEGSREEDEDDDEGTKDGPVGLEEDDHAGGMGFAGVRGAKWGADGAGGEEGDEETGAPAGAGDTLPDLR
mmetsp:Transcript_60452/g.166062  ORF Transcript_60452/g.166062 Transcript_60452/m.166062 type:complete len:301 (+) Transcript_60452:154-1056(+)